MAKYAYMGEKMRLLQVLFIWLIYYKIIKHPKFNNEMHSAENWVLNPVILHYWHNLPILILCSALLQFVLLKALYK